MKILLVEDELFIAEPTAEKLKKQHYQVDVVYDGEDGLSYGLSGMYDCILLDIMLPKRDGMSVLRELRQRGIRTPIIMLTAKGDTEDRVAGLDFGADDYLPKPYDPTELLARIKAVARRTGQLEEGNVLRFGDLELNPQTLALKSERFETKLRLKESQLLELLMRRKGMLTPKELLIERLWDSESDLGASTVEYHVSMVRKRLKDVGSKVKISVVRGAGYALQS